jgi:hypothetical protein
MTAHGVYRNGSWRPERGTAVTAWVAVQSPQGTGASPRMPRLTAAQRAPSRRSVRRTMLATALGSAAARTSSLRVYSGDRETGVRSTNSLIGLSSNSVQNCETRQSRRRPTISDTAYFPVARDRRELQP